MQIRSWSGCITFEEPGANIWHTIRNVTRILKSAPYEDEISGLSTDKICQGVGINKTKNGNEDEDRILENDYI